MKYLKNTALRMTVLLFIGGMLFIPLLGGVRGGSSFAQSTTIIDSLLTILKTTTEDTSKVKTLNSLCKKYLNNNPEKALEYGKQALAIGKELLSLVQGGDAEWVKQTIIKSLNNLGKVYYYQGNYEKAEEHYLQCLKMHEELLERAEQSPAAVGNKIARNKKGIAKNLNDLGEVHTNLGNYEKALSYSLQSLKIYEEIGNKSGIASSLNTIGVIYFYQENHEKTIDYFLQSLKILEELGHKQDIAAILGNIGIIYKNQGDYKKAMNYHLQCLEVFEELELKRQIAASLINIGNVYLSQAEHITTLQIQESILEKAIIYHIRALKIQEELGNKQGIAISLINVGEGYSKQGKNQKAIEYLKRSLSIVKEIGAKEIIKDTYKDLAAIYAKMGEYSLASPDKKEYYKKAYEYNQLFSQIKDTLLNEENSKQIAEMQEKYESEKREKEIELLNKEKALQSTELNRQRIIIWSGAGGLLLVIALAFFIYRGYRQKKKANILLAAQKQVIEVKNKDITDSIRYAEQIQQAILPTDEQIKGLLPDSFVLFKPKDIVSGDFYWIVPRTDQGGVLFAACDCTGHGVPGAFMSMIGNALLNETVNEKGITQPSEILNEIRKGIINSLKQKGEIGEQQDGMDAALCNLDIRQTAQSGQADITLQYAGANNPLFIVRKGELMETKADKQPIGIIDDLKPFTNHTIELKKGDTIYIFSDGFSDQFGGSKNKKFTTKRLKQLFLTIQDKSMPEQKEILNKTLEDWKGDEEQLDDILVIGVRV